MSGIILIVLLAFWLYLAIKMSSFFVSKMMEGAGKVAVRIFVFAMFFIVPVLDDIVGGFQFRHLCETEVLLVYNEKKVKGKTAQLKRPVIQIINKVIPIREHTWDWVDQDTGETLVKYKDYYAEGGWLSRFIGFPQGSPPYTFNGSCGSKKARLIFQELNITKNVKNYYGE